MEKGEIEEAIRELEMLKVRLWINEARETREDIRTAEIMIQNAKKFMSNPSYVLS